MLQLTALKGSISCRQKWRQIVYWEFVSAVVGTLWVPQQCSQAAERPIQHGLNARMELCRPGTAVASGATSNSLHLQRVCNRSNEAVGGGQQIPCLSRFCTAWADTALPSCTEEAETAPMLVRPGNGDKQAGKHCDLVNSGTRKTVPSPHASVAEQIWWPSTSRGWTSSQQRFWSACAWDLQQHWQDEVRDGGRRLFAEGMQAAKLTQPGRRGYLLYTEELGPEHHG